PARDRRRPRRKDASRARRGPPRSPSGTGPIGAAPPHREPDGRRAPRAHPASSAGRTRRSRSRAEASRAAAAAAAPSASPRAQPLPRASRALGSGAPPRRPDRDVGPRRRGVAARHEVTAVGRPRQRERPAAPPGPELAGDETVRPAALLLLDGRGRRLGAESV